MLFNHVASVVEVKQYEFEYDLNFVFEGILGKVYTCEIFPD